MRMSEDYQLADVFSGTDNEYVWHNSKLGILPVTVYARLIASV